MTDGEPEGADYETPEFYLQAKLATNISIGLFFI